MASSGNASRVCVYTCIKRNLKKPKLASLWGDRVLVPSCQKDKGLWEDNAAAVTCDGITHASVRGKDHRAEAGASVHRGFEIGPFLSYSHI